MKNNQNVWLFLLLCLGLGFLANISFLHGEIGISFLVFVIGFYAVLFVRFRFSFQHRRIGLLFTIAIWALSGSYLLYDNQTFYHLNLFVIPLLMLAHIVLITSPRMFKWNTPRFLSLIILQLMAAKDYFLDFLERLLTRIFPRMRRQISQMISRMTFGLLAGFILLFLMMQLNVLIDSSFQEMFLNSLQFFTGFQQMTWLYRIMFIFMSGLLFFSLFQALETNQLQVLRQKTSVERKSWNSTSIMTMLTCLNLFYLFLIFPHVKNFFNDQWRLIPFIAPSAKSSFLAICMIMLINWVLLICCLKCVKEKNNIKQWVLKALYSVLVIHNVLFLLLAYQSLGIQGQAYSFTILLLIAYAFVVFLLIIYIYTFINIWMGKISLLHFYLIVGLIFYTVLNAIHIEQIVVDQNIEHYQVTGEVDLEYMYSLSDAGLNGLMTLYELGHEDPQLIELLLQHQEAREEMSQRPWQSFNFTNEKVTKRLQQIDLSGFE